MFRARIKILWILISILGFKSFAHAKDLEVSPDQTAAPICEPVILKQGGGLTLQKRAVQSLVSLIYDEVVRALFYENSVPKERRHESFLMVRYDKNSTQSVPVNMARLNQAKKLFLQQKKKELELVEVILAHRNQGRYQPLVSLLTEWIAYKPRESGLLDQEYVLYDVIYQEVVNGARAVDPVLVARLDYVQMLHHQLWHQQLYASFYNGEAPPMLLPTLARYYGEPGLGALEKVVKP